jgi:hypothetical protein
MSAIAFDWVRAGRQAKAERPAKAAEGCSRREEFRRAVDQYIASYALAQRRRAEVIDKPVLTRLKRGTAAGLIGSIRRQCRRGLDAIREIWLFSPRVCPDWRLPRLPR